MPGDKQSPEVAASALRPTIGFICPLYLELQAVRAIFDKELFNGPVEKHVDGELHNYYYYGKIGDRTAVAVTFAKGKVGPDWAVLHAERLLENHKSLKERTSSCLLIGIAGGIWSKKQDVRLGDVVIATQVLDWTSGKFNANDEFESTQHPRDVSEEVEFLLPGFVYHQSKLRRRIVEQVDNMKLKDASDDELWECPGAGQDDLFQADVIHEDGEEDCQNCEQRFVEREERDNCQPKVHLGLIGTGNVVLKDAQRREKLSQEKGVLAVEMEASAVMKAYRRLVIIRGISDYADSHKNKQWQRYAATTAAACARLWIDDLPPIVEAMRRQSIVFEEQPPTPINLPTQRQRRKSSRASPSDGSLPLPTFRRTNRPRPGSISMSASDSEFSNSSRSSSHQSPKPEDKGDWNEGLRVKASAVHLSFLDATTQGETVTRDWDDSEIAFELEGHPHRIYAQRRLRIIEADRNEEGSHVIWLPHTHVRVKCDGAILKLQFSNCNKRARRSSGQFDTKNGITTFTTKYDPNDPNVQVEILLAKESDAELLAQFILSREESFLPKSSTTHEFSRCRMLQTSASPRGEDTNTALVWHVDLDQEYLDIGCFSERIHFEISPSDFNFCVSLGHMDKFIYDPVDSSGYAVQPPTKIRKNQSGRPGRSRFGGSESASNRLDIVVGRDEICQILTKALSRLSSWSMRAFILDVEEVVLKTARRLNSSRKLGPSQMSFWTNGDDIRLLILREQYKSSNGGCWVACTARCSTIDARISSGDLVLDVDGAEGARQRAVYHEGDYLSANTFLPIQESSNWKSLKIRLENASRQGHLEEFVGAIKELQKR